MNQEFQQGLAGYPSFVCQVDDGVNWWSPKKTGGDGRSDYFAGLAHFEAMQPLMSAMAAGETHSDAGHPAVILGRIIGGMSEFGPMEYGFLEGLAAKALAGRLPTSVRNITGAALPVDLEQGEAAAQATIQLARISNDIETIVEELMGALHLKFESRAAFGFIWTVCAAATSGALH